MTLTQTPPSPGTAGNATSANQTTEITSLQLIDDIVDAIGAAVNKFAVVGAEWDDTSTKLPNEDQTAQFRITRFRALHVNNRNNAGTEIFTSTTPAQVSLANTAANAVAVKVDGSAVTQPVSIAATVTIQGTVTANTAQTTIVSGAKSAIGTSAVQITASSVAANVGVLVKASSANAGIIYVGPSTVTNGTTDATDGFEIKAGESVLIEINNANKVYVIGSAGTQRISWMVA